MSHAGYHTDMDCSCTDCVIRYKKWFHQHAWDNFRNLDSTKLIGNKEYVRDTQEFLCKKYNVIIPLWQTKNEKRLYKIKKIINMLMRMIKGFKLFFKQQHERNQIRKAKKLQKKSKKTSKRKFKLGIPKLFGDNNTNYDGLLSSGKQKDLSGIFGSSKQKDLSGIFGSSKQKDLSGLLNSNTQKDLSGFLRSSEKKDYSGLIGSSKDKDLSGIFGNKKTKPPRF